MRDRSQRAGSRLLVAVAITLLFTAAPRAQTITRVTPEAAAPGDLVILTGPNLQGVSIVRFFATVGGFVGTWTVDVTPQSVSSTRVTALVPMMAAFAPPNATPPGNPVGTVQAINPLGPSAPNTLSFFYMQAIPTVTTAGLGTTQPGLGRPVVGFTIAGGPPVTGNAGFTLTLENAIPGAVAQIFVGAPDPAPSVMVGDGLVAIDLTQPFFSLPSATVDAAGDVHLPLPIPTSPLNFTFMLQWLEVDPATGQSYISNGLQSQL